jgi:prevent-host-death family protein
MVSFISTRELSRQPGKVMRKAKAEGPQVITRNGKPAAYLIPTSGSGIEADLDALRRLLMDWALDAARVQAARTGTSELMMDEINAEIAAARSERKGLRAPNSSRVRVEPIFNHPFPAELEGVNFNHLPDGIDDENTLRELHH